MPAYRITDKGKYSQIVAYTGAKIESFWAVGKQVCIDIEGPDFVISSKDGVFLQIPISNIAEPQTQTNEDLIQALAFMVSAADGYEDDSIYVSDGTLTGDRALLGDAYDLLFSNIDEFEVSSRVNRFTASESNILTGRNVFNGARNEDPITTISSNYTANLLTDFILIASANVTIDLPTANIGDVLKVAANGFNVTLQGVSTLIDGLATYPISGQESVILSYTSAGNYTVIASNKQAGGPPVTASSAYASVVATTVQTVISAANTWTQIASSFTNVSLVDFALVAPCNLNYTGAAAKEFNITLSGSIYNAGFFLSTTTTDIAVFVNGVPLAAEQGIRTTVNATAISLQANAALQALDLVELRVRNTTNTNNLIVENLQITVTEK